MQEVSFRLNGTPQRVIVDPDRPLLKVIREDLRLTGTKEGCSAGHCGTCAVLLDDQVVLACKVPVSKAQGGRVVTIEGIGTPSEPHPLQLSFAKTGAVQCGFCTPGMIVRSKALLDASPDAGREEIKKALQPHLCRCTGYQRIFEAVELGARILKGEAPRPDVYGADAEKTGAIGEPIVRRDALEKATGTTRYAADLAVDGCLHLKVVRSPHASARIVSIDGSAAEAVPGVVAVLTAKDVPGSNILKMSADDQPLLCSDVVRYAGDPVAVVAAATEALAEQAAALVKVEYEVRKPVLSVAESLAEGAAAVHEGRPNLFFRQPIVHGDAEKGFAEADAVVGGDFWTQVIEHAYLEPDCGIGFVGEQGEIVVLSGSQNIHAHRKTIAGALNAPVEQVRVIQPPMGGAFGGKLDVSVGGVLALAAWKLRRPVRLVYTREEAFAATTKRHGFDMKVSVGAKKDGTLTALRLDSVADGGAYASFSGSVVTRGMVHASGPYRFPHANLLGTAVYTNTVMRGAMRGFGVPQVAFALESSLDDLAEKLGLDPLDLRVKNGYVQGDTTVCGQVLTDACGYQECLAELRPRYERAKKEAAEKSTDRVKRGVGVAGTWFGPGRSSPDQSEAWAELLPDGTLQVWIGSSDMGQGSDTMFWQIAARTMGYPLGRVRVCSTDTAITPDGNFSAGSRQTYVSGKAVYLAVTELKDAMTKAGAKTYEDLKAKGLPTLYKAINHTETTKLDPADGHGVPWETYDFGVQMAEVAVDVETGKVEVLKITAVHDFGTIINRLNVEGQLHGGISMGLGYALKEEFIPGETDSYAKFRIPRARETPEMEVLTLDIPRENGPYGAAGAGEFADVPTAPAIVNAIKNACGARVRSLPVTPEKVKAALGRA